MKTLVILPPPALILYPKVFSMLETAEFNLAYVTHSGWICCKISTISKNHDVVIFFEKSVYYLFSRTSNTLFSSVTLEFIRQDSFQTQFLMTWHYFFYFYFFYLPGGRILRQKFVTRREKVLLEPSVRSHAKSIFV